MTAVIGPCAPVVVIGLSGSPQLSDGTRGKAIGLAGAVRAAWAGARVIGRVCDCPFFIDPSPVRYPFGTTGSGTVGSGILLIVDRLGCPLRASGDDSGP